MAELVSSGEASPLELVDAAIERVEQVNGELNAVIHPLFEEAREAAAGDVPDGPFKGVPFLLKDLGAAFAGQPLHMGMQVLKDADFKAAGRHLPGAALPRRRPDHDRQDEHARARDPADHRAGRLRSDAGTRGTPPARRAAPPAAPAPPSPPGWCRWRTPTTAAARSGSRPPTTGSSGLKPTRQRITEGPLVGDNLSGLTCELVVSRSVRDTRPDPRRRAGSGAGRPLRGPRAVAPLRRGAQRRERRAADRDDDGAGGRRPRSPPIA